MDIVLVGHRGVGKTTLARGLREREGYDWVDLDHAIQASTGRTPAELIAESEELFRRIESETLSELLDSESSDVRVISVGGGCQAFPSGPLYIWIRRSGWWEVAADERQQVWPELSLTEEFARMRTEREPRWAAHAHLVHDVPRGRTIERTVRDLATRIEWLAGVRGGWASDRTWMVPSGPECLERAISDAQTFGLAGVEIRSDLFDARSQEGVEIPFIASLRGPDAGWLDGSSATIVDVDIAFLPAVIESGVLERLEPRRLLLSTHPDGVDASDVEELARAANLVVERYPMWASELGLKYAPAVASFFDAGAGMAMMRPLQRRGWEVTYLPQGRRFAWMRPLLLRMMNATNYLAVGLSQHHAEDGAPGVGASWDLNDWLGHLAGPRPDRFDLLVGASVDGSQGDLWHRRAALAAGEATDYLKVNVEPGGLEEALGLFEGIGIRGLSITSPHKEAVLSCPGVDTPPGLEAINTLRRTEFGWTATDTDTSGMVGALREIEEAGVRPGKVAVIGSGGVSDAVVRGVQAAPGWRLDLHVRARDGWPEDAGPFRLIVNAAGQWGNAAESPPEAEAWLDLHYTSVDAPPGAYRHFIGDAFFEYQAAAQRDFWNE